MKDLLKKMLPTVISLAAGALTLIDPTIRAEILAFGAQHPTLSVLALNLYIGFANFLHGLQVPSVPVAQATLAKAVVKEQAKAAQP